MVRMIHDCAINIRTEEMYLLPIRTRYQRICASIRQLFVASIKNPRAHRYLRSHNAIIQERRRHYRNHNHIIHPFSIFR